MADPEELEEKAEEKDEESADLKNVAEEQRTVDEHAKEAEEPE